MSLITDVFAQHLIYGSRFQFLYFQTVILLLFQGLIFMFQYCHLRDGNQEACYNIGRAFHQIGKRTYLCSYFGVFLKRHSDGNRLNLLTENPSFQSSNKSFLDPLKKRRPFFIKNVRSVNHV